MPTPKTVEHQGIVQSVDEHTVHVSIINRSACASCHLKGACSIADLKEKMVDVPLAEKSFEQGEKVTVYFAQSLGFKALFLGYLLPFIVLMITLIVSLQITGNEAFSGLASLAVLAPYYLILYLLRNNIKRKFSFSIRKL